MIRGAVVLAVAALAAWPALAQANGLDICVNAEGCANDKTVTTLEDALAIADDDVQEDTIHLGAGTFEPTGNQFTISTAVDIVGAGRGATTIAAPKPTNTTWTVFLSAGGSSIKGVTILHADTAAYGLVMNTGVADDVSVVGTADRPVNNGKGVLFNSGTSTLKNSSVSEPLGGAHNDWAVWINAGTVSLDNVTLTGDNAVVQQAGTVALTRSLLTGHRVYVVNGAGSATMADSVLRARAGSTATPIAINNTASSPAPTSVAAKHLTITGPGSGEGLHVEAMCGGGATSTLTANSVTVSGFPLSTTQTGCAAASVADTCGAPAADSANLQLDWFHHDGSSLISGGCYGRSNLRTGDPGFVSSSDLRPRQPSPLIDTGDPAPNAGGEKDFNGANRVIDGDGTGGARRDIGAYEYLRSTPTVSASVTPSFGPLSQIFGFSAAGLDADGEPLQYSWTFDDGTSFGQASLSKAFTTLGAHSGQVQVTDTAGLTAASSAAVTVEGGTTDAGSGTPPPASPVAGPPVPQSAAPRDTTPPKVTVKGGTLLADKKGVLALAVGCPAAESEACKLSFAASSAKKIALVKGKPPRISALGAGSGSVAPGKTAKVKLKLSKAALAYLLKAKSLPASIRVVAKDAAGNSATVTVKVKIKAPKKT